MNFHQIILSQTVFFQGLGLSGLRQAKLGVRAILLR